MTRKEKYDRVHNNIGDIKKILSLIENDVEYECQKLLEWVPRLNSEFNTLVENMRVAVEPEE